MMSLALQENERDTALHIREIEVLNRGLTGSNAKLTTLLDASRLTTSSLELDHTLADSESPGGAIVEECPEFAAEVLVSFAASR